MEKYRRFADHGTGLQPFIPVAPQKGSAAGWVLLLLRLPVVAAVAAVVLLATPVRAVLSLIPLLGQVAELLLLQLPVKVLLGTAGVWVSSTVWPLTAAAARMRAAPPACTPGTVLLTNFTGYVDVLLHASRCRCLFAFAQDHDTSLPPLLVKGFWGALAFSLLPYPTARDRFSASSGKTLQEAAGDARRRGSVLVVFFEGAATNGRGLLSCPGGLVEGKGLVFVVQGTLHHPADGRGAGGGRTPFPVPGPQQSAAAHFFGLLRGLSHPLRVVTVLPQQTPSYASTPDNAVLQATLLRTLSEASKLKLMTKTREDKAAFLEHWTSTQGTDYVHE